MKTGDRVQLKQDVDRFPHFIARAGMTGTVQHYAEDEVLVKMDDRLDNCDEWENCIVWTSEDIEQGCLEADLVTAKAEAYGEEEA